MRFLLLLACLLATPALAQPLTDTQKMASLARVWGFLKYHHPAVATGKHDWDNQLVRRLSAVRQAADAQALSAVYEQLLDELGPTKRCRRCEAAPADPRNLDLRWLSDSLVLTPAVRQRLAYLLENRYQGASYYVQQPDSQSGYALLFDNEKLYADQRLPDEAHRLLALFRYWNIITYFFPYKYAIGGSWNNALASLIPVFQQATTEVAYEQALYRMVASINDSHGFMQHVDQSRSLRAELGMYWLPFALKLLGNTAIITRRYADSLSDAAVFPVGTVITAIDNEPVQVRIDRLRPLVAASNEETFRRDGRNLIGIGPTTTARLTIQPNGLTKTVPVPRYRFRELGQAARVTDTDRYPISQWLADSVGYVNMGRLASRQVDSVMRPLLSAKALIFDLRNYPQGTFWLVGRYLTSQPLPFVRFTGPNLRFPGTFTTRQPTRLPRISGQKFGGKVFVLVNEETQSQAEFTAMAFRAVPGTTLVGSPTAGADGNIAWVPLPGGYRTAFSGLGVYYPDGRETQRVGIVPDVLARPTAAGLQMGRDEVLEQAIELTRRPAIPLRQPASGE